MTSNDTLPAITPEIRAVEVPPGTTYDDEPDMVVPSGWWVLGQDYYADEGQDIAIYVQYAIDCGGNDIRRQLAHYLAGLLATAALQQPDQDSEPTLSSTAPARVLDPDQIPLFDLPTQPTAAEISQQGR